MATFWLSWFLDISIRRMASPAAAANAKRAASEVQRKNNEQRLRLETEFAAYLRSCTPDGRLSQGIQIALYRQKQNQIRKQRRIVRHSPTFWKLALLHGSSKKRVRTDDLQRRPTCTHKRMNTCISSTSRGSSALCAANELATSMPVFLNGNSIRRRTMRCAVVCDVSDRDRTA